MTKIDIISGFLGAGKTTFIKKMIDEAFTGEKIVLIENEFGEVGIDGGFLKDAGIQITEMNSGCICCSLVGDFGKNLNEVITKYHPDRILIEPSGVGKLSDVIKAVQDVQSEIDAKLNSFTTVVDVTKCRIYRKNFGEFFSNQIEYAGAVILSRTDKAKPEKEIGGITFRLGDKVMQIKNNYQLEWEITTKYGLTVDKGMGIFNGDMGIVTEINTYTETLEVEYDEKRKVKYPFELLEELELAYAITIHKSQGSEYPAVVIPLLSGPRQLFHRNLLYTAITRARKCVTIVGSDQTFHEMIRNTNEHNRNTSLAERIREFCG